MGATSDKSQQNQAAAGQIQGNTQQAQQNLQQYLAANPSVLSQAAPPQMPQQFGGVQGGAPPQQGLPPQLLAMLAHMQGGQSKTGGAPAMRAPQGAPQGPGAGVPHPQPPPAPAPPGLLGLLTPGQH